MPSLPTHAVGHKDKPKPAATPALRRTDIGNADRLVRWHGKDLRYCGSWKKWLTWDGRRWKVDDACEAERRAQDTVRELAAEAGREKDTGQRQALLKHATASADAR